ncbi:MAG: ferrous iron transport protein A [Proteobacteria bacterium]|jgi:Fe2+ transport system protein FeoA|nr:ferrous iron transport protein A [Pseudomonadota bacterium]
MGNRIDVYHLETGKRAIVRSVNASDIIRQRLFDMGVLPTCEIVKERCALGGDPVWVKVGTVQLALRKAEAESVIVELI